MKAIFLIFTVLFSFNVFAYIPNLKMIADRVGKNHGYGSYVVDQEIVINDNQNSYVVHEQWLIEDENKMRVRITGVNELKNYLFESKKKVL